MIIRFATVVAIILLLLLTQLPKKTILKLPIQNDFSQKISAGSKDVTPVPLQKTQLQSTQQFSASAIVVIDAKTGTPLYEKNPNLKHFPASLAKLMTALVALEKCLPQDVVEVKSIEGGGTQMGLDVGDRITVENLLYGLLINSGNDAAHVLAKNCSDSQDTFVQKMNEKAQSLAMSDSHFMNPTGFDNNFQFSTAADIAKLANVAISNPLIAKIVSTKSTVVVDISGNKTYYLANINELLGEVNGVEGIKTGQTEGALENLVSKTTRGGNSIIVVVLGSQDRFGESEKLIESTFENFSWPNS